MKERKKKILFSEKMQVLALRMKNDATTLLWVSSKRRGRFIHEPETAHSVLLIPTFPPPTLNLTPSTRCVRLDDKSQNTGTDSHDASTKLHSTTSASSRSSSSTASSASTRTGLSSLSSADIAIGSQQSGTALLSNGLDGLEVGGRAIRVLEQTGCAGGEEGLGAGGAETDGVGGGAAGGTDGVGYAGDLREEVLVVDAEGREGGTRKRRTPHWGTPAVRSTAVEVEAAAELVDEAAMAVAAKMAREV